MIYFYYGSDTFTLSRELKNLKQNFPGMVEEIEIGDFSDIDLKTRLTEVLQSQGLFSQDKLVFLKNFLGRIKDFPKSEEYLSNVIKNPSAAGLVFEQTDRFDKRLKFFKALQKSAEMRQFDIPTGPALEKWVENYLVYTGFKIEPLALREFVRLTSPEAEPFAPARQRPRTRVPRENRARVGLERRTGVDQSEALLQIQR